MATDLREEGLEVDLVPPNQVKRLDEYEAVVVGGALYASRWHRAAKRFVKRHTGELRERPVFFFSSGPLDDSATKKDIPPVKRVQALMERVGARGHVTFGGRLSPDAKGFPASAMAKNTGRRLARPRSGPGLGPVHRRHHSDRGAPRHLIGGRHRQRVRIHARGAFHEGEDLRPNRHRRAFDARPVNLQLTACKLRDLANKPERFVKYSVRASEIHFA